MILLLEFGFISFKEKLNLLWEWKLCEAKKKRKKKKLSRKHSAHSAFMFYTAAGLDTCYDVQLNLPFKISGQADSPGPGYTHV